MPKKKKELSPTQKVEIAVGLTAAAVAAAGTYFLYGSKNASKNRQKVKSWSLKAKAEVLDTLEKAQQMSKADYDKLIEGVAATYATVKNASKSDIATFKKEMKEHWTEIEKQGKKLASTAVNSVAKKAAKKAPAKKAPAKKAAKKAPAKKAAKKAPAKKAA